jgi:hypothetical protein
MRALVAYYVLPGLAWLALVGLAVPVLLAEGGTPVHALRRSVALARADFVHVLGGLCGLVLAVFVAAGALAVLLHGQAGNSALTAGALADLVLFPILFIGASLLYVDQEARLRLRAAAVPA